MAEINEQQAQSRAVAIYTLAGMAAVGLIAFLVMA